MSYTFPLQPLGVVTNLADLRRVLNERRVSLKFTMSALDHRCGFQEGYTGKLFCKGPSARGFGPMSLEVILLALGLELIAVPKLSPNPLGEKDLALTTRMSELGKRSWEARKNTDKWRQVCRKGALAKAAKMRAHKETED